MASLVAFSTVSPSKKSELVITASFSVKAPLERFLSLNTLGISREKCLANSQSL